MNYKVPHIKFQGEHMNLIEYVFLVIPAVLFVAVVAAVIIFVLEDCEHLLSRGKGQGHE